MKQSTFSAVMANSIKNLLQRYTKGIRFVAVLTVLLTMEIGQVWADVNYKGGYFYFDNSLNVNKGYVMLCGRRHKENGSENWYTAVTTFNKDAITGTKLYYTGSLEGSTWNTSTWNGWVVISDASQWGNGSFENWTGAGWCSAYRNDYNFNAGSTYVLRPTSTSKSQSIEVDYHGSYSGLNHDQTVYKYTSTNNGSSYSTMSVNSGTVTISAYKMTGNGTAANTNNKQTINAAATTSKAVTAAYTGEVTVTATANTGYTFVGWFESTSATTAVSTSTSYTYNAPNSTKSIYARFKAKQYTVTWEVNGETYSAGSPTTSVAYNSKVTTLPTAPSIDCNGKVFVGWSNQEVTNGQKPSVLFTSASNAPAVTEATTYRAVFADQEGFDGNVDFANRWNTTTDLTQFTESTPLTIGNVDLSFTKGTGSTSPKYYVDRTSIRLYYGNTMKIDAGGATITKVTLHLNDKGTTDDLNQIFANNTSILEKDEYVTDCSWTGNANSVTIRIGERNDNNSTTSGHRKIQSLEVITTGGTVSYSDYTTSCIPIYTITYDLNDGNGDCAEAEVEKGSNYTICATTPIKEGYIFQGWEYNGTTYREGATISNIQSDITLVAQWNPITYSVVFDKNEGSGTMDRQTFTYDVAQSLSANTFIRNKYEFAGWNTTANGSGTSYDDEEEVINLTATNGAIITLYAQWQKLYTVTFYNIGSLLDTKTQETVGRSIECPTITAPCDDYEFVGWSETAVANNSTSYTNVSCPITPTEDIELHAVYSQGDGGGGTETVEDELTYTGIGLGIASSGNATYTAFSDKQFTSDAEYAGNINKFNSSSNPTNVIQIRSNNSNSGIVTTTSGGKAKKVVVVWQANTAAGRTLNVYGKNDAYSNATDLYNSSTQGDPLGTIVKGTSTELEIEGDYEYIGLRSASGAMYLTSITITWETSGGGSTTTYTTTPDCCTPLAEITGMTFSAMTRSITVSVPDSYENTNVDGYIFNLYNAATGGVATTYDTNDKNEKSHTFTGLTPNTAYHFTIIAKGSGAYCNSEETSPRESYTTLSQYTVTWDPAGGHWSGNYSDKVDTYDYQAAITQPAKPERTGYTFNGWDKTPATIMPAENLTYTAQWNIVTYTITYENLNGASNSNPTSYNVESETITLQAPGNRDDFAFGGWYSDADYTTSVTQIPQGSTDNITLYAKWIAIYSVTWMVNGLEYTKGNPDTEVLDGDKVESLPTPPTPDEGNNIYCGEVFAGWTDKPIDRQTDTYPDPLFTTIEGSPEIKQNTTFYAVFADYKE